MSQPKGSGSARAGQVEVKSLGQLAQLVVLAGRRRTTRDTLRDRIEPLKRGGIVAVDGEDELLGLLNQYLDQTDKALAVIAADDDRGMQTLTELASYLNNVDWDVADEVLRSLTTREEIHQAAGQQAQAEVGEWRARLDPLQPKLDQAVQLYALVSAEQAETLVIDSLVTQADRAVTEGKFLDAATTLHRLRTGVPLPVPGRSQVATAGQTRTPELLLQSVDVSLARAKVLAGYTELVLLRTSPKDAEMIEYQSILRVPRSGATYSVSVRASRMLAQADFEHICALTTRVGAAEGTRRRRHVTPARLRRPTEPEDPELVQRELRILGELLWRLVIPELVQRSLESHFGQVTITTNEQELPWELVRIGDAHLVTRCPVARMPLGWSMPRIGRRRDEGHKLRFLLVHADPEGNLPGAKVEVETIRDGLERDWGDRIEVVVVAPTDAKIRLFNETLVSGDYDVIHYAGHAAFDEGKPDLSGLFLEPGQMFTADKVERLLAGQPLVFLNACESSKSANAAADPSYLGHQSEGLASAFLYGGAVACVGSRWPVFDQSAGEFAVAFYKHLLMGNMVGEALRLAREASLATRGDEVTWATYTLYGDPSFHITTPGAAGTPSET